MSYDPHARAKATPDTYGRQIGESYRDACERMLGQLRAQDVDLKRLQSIELRARKVAAAVREPVTAFNVRYILTGERTS